MIYTDVSEVVRGNCTYFNSANTMYSYDNNIRRNYVLVNDKWYRTQEYPSSSINLSNYVCLTQEQLEHIPASGNALEPFYWVGALGVLVFIFGIVYKIFIAPVMRSRL